MPNFDVAAEVDMMLAAREPPRAFDPVREIDEMLAGRSAGSMRSVDGRALTREGGMADVARPGMFASPSQPPRPRTPAFDAAGEVDEMLSGRRSLPHLASGQNQRPQPTVADQWQSGVETVAQGMQGVTLANAMRNLEYFDRIDRGHVPANLHEDALGYYTMTPEERTRARQRIQQRFGHTISRLVESRSRQAGLPRVPEVDALSNALSNYDFGEAWRVFSSNPGGIMQQVTVESLPSSLPGIVAGVVASPLGRAPAVVGGLVGGYASEFGPRLTEKLFEALQEHGVDVRDPEAIRAAIIADPSIVHSAAERAGRGALGPAIFDALSMRLARGIRPGAGTVRNIGRVGGDVAREAVFEGAGEALGQRFQGDPLKLGEIALETIGGLGQGGPTTLAGTIIEARENARQLDEAHVPPRHQFDAAAEVDQMLRVDLQGVDAGAQPADVIGGQPEQQPVAAAVQGGTPLAPGHPPSESAPMAEVSPRDNPRRTQIATNAWAELTVTPEAQAHAKQIHSIFETTVARKLPTDTRVAYVERVFDQDGNAQLGAYVDATRTLYVALRATDATGAWRSEAEIRGTISHEVIEALHARGLFRNNERAALLRHAPAWIKHYDIAARYPGASLAQMQVEAIAERLGGWLGGQRAGISGPALAAFRRVAEVLRALAGWARGQGFHTPESILRRIESGEVARREAHPPDLAGPGSNARFQAAPKGAASASGDRTDSQQAGAGEGPIVRPEGVQAPVAPDASASLPRLQAWLGEARFQTPRSGGPHNLSAAAAPRGLDHDRGPPWIDPPVPRIDRLLEGSSTVALGSALPSVPLRIPAPYRKLARTLPRTFQAHHLNQNAAYRGVIPKSEGLAVVAQGNAFTQPGTSHYTFHQSLEQFWAQYRRDGMFFPQIPSNAEYGQALEQALRNSGYSSGNAAYLAWRAAAQRTAYGLNETDPVPRIPQRINQVKP